MNQTMPQWLWTLLGFMGVLVLAATLILLIFFIRDKANLTQTKNTITVAGEGKTKAVPDEATVNIGVQATAETADDAQSKATSDSKKLYDFLRTSGVAEKDIALQQFNVQTRYNYKPDGTNAISGYEAMQTVTVTINDVQNSTELMSTILGGATKNGANQIYGTNFGFADITTMREAARKQAIEKAKQSAEELARNAGAKLGKLVSVTEDSNSGGYPVPIAADMSAVAESRQGGGPSVSPGQQDIIVRVSLVYELE